MRKIAQFFLGLITSSIYLAGIGLASFVYFENQANFQTFYYGATSVSLISIILQASVVCIPFYVLVYLYCPRFLKWGTLIPLLLAIGLGGYLINHKHVKSYFTDDIKYRSCVGNFDHGKGIEDCTTLIFKLEKTGEIQLKDIQNTKGDYWLAEMLSYRGRHYMRNDQFQFGKEDFARAFLLPEGAAVVAGNLAEAGFIRQELFEADYEKALAQLKALVVQENVSQIEHGSNFLQAQVITVVDFCRLSTGREEDNCKALIKKEVLEN